jgi:REP element-mobilizing transposase RayT
MARPTRIRGYDYTGVQQYFLTICTHDRVQHFTNGVVVDLVVRHFLQTAAEYSMAILVYCVMPDHVHLLIEGMSDESDLLAFTSKAKQRTAWEFKSRFNQRLWQKGYWEHVVRDSERTEGIIEYIVNNPLRKNLVENPRDYPYWGSSVYDREAILRFIGCARG